MALNMVKFLNAVASAAPLRFIGNLIVMHLMGTLLSATCAVVHCASRFEFRANTLICGFRRYSGSLGIRQSAAPPVLLARRPRPRTQANER